MIVFASLIEPPCRLEQLLAEHNCRLINSTLSPYDLITGHLHYLLIDNSRHDLNIRAALRGYFVTDVADDIGDEIHDMILQELDSVRSTVPEDSVLSMFQYMSNYDLVLEYDEFTEAREL